MSVQRTLSIIKPDAVSKNVVGEIVTRFEKAGLRVVAAKMVQLSEREAGGFYAEHKERPFFKDLVSFMTSGPVVVQVLEGENAIAKNRELMGATDPKKADAGYHPRRFRRVHRRKRRPWLGLRSVRRARDLLLLRSYRSLRAHPLRMSAGQGSGQPAFLASPAPRAGFKQISSR
ncbi:nucleoside diphosphate kinase [Pseudomonas psychrotolerans]|nr:nucleoside diphosphate kinase [Pseudomonas psychrotolerans]